MSSLADSDPKELRPVLHAKIEQFEGEDLAILHRVALQLELDRVSQTLDEEFDMDRQAEKLPQLPEIVREARAAVRKRGGG